jgi:hypothetical protein
MSIQTTLATEVYLVGQLLLEEQTLNNVKPTICRAGTQRPTVSKGGGQN